MTGPVSRKAVTRATLWTLLDFVLERGANFAIIIVLARLLTPGEFGTVALLAVFIALATLLSESGLGQALIQREQVDEADRSTAFWINLLLASTMTALLFVCAPAVAAFFAQPMLVPLMQIMGLGVIVGAFGTVQRALLLRALQYRRLMMIRIGATILSGSLAVALALAGYGVFALAWQACTLALATSALLWFSSDWRPRRIFDRDAARRLFGFGGYMLASSVLETIYSRAYTLFIGKLSGPAVLGQYGRADATLALVQGFVTYPLNQIALPALSRLAHDPARIRDGIRDGLKISMLINAPAMLGLATVAEPFVLAAYGDQWTQAVPFLQILCLGGLLMPIHILNLQALMAIGRSDLFFWLEIVKKIVGVAILFGGSHWGPIGIAWAVVIAGFIGALVNTSLSGRYFGYGALAQLLDIAPGVLLGIGSAAAALLSLHYLPLAANAHIAKLALAALTGGIFWGAFAILLDLAGARKLVSDFRQGLGRR